MFERLPPPSRDGAVTVYIGGEPHRARVSDSVAAAMLAANVDRCRTTPVSGAPRAP